MDFVCMLNENNGVRSIRTREGKPENMMSSCVKWKHKNGKSLLFVLRSDNLKQKTMTFERAVEIFDKED